MPAKSATSTDSAFRALLDAFVAANGADSPSIRRALSRALRAGLPKAKAREAMRMVHLFGGFPRTLNALEALAAASAGSKVNITDRSNTTDTIDQKAGAALFTKIYGSSAGAVKTFLFNLDPCVATWIHEHAYGRVLTRRGLAAHERELLAVAALISTGQDKQLVSHLRGAVRCGATDAQIAQAVAAGLRGANVASRARLQKLINKTASRTRLENK
ncbi:MAG: carboxymuconolactone decarboxylase family protein [Planctomycetota bacterium]